jgi:nucleoside-diphosphate-sugar epimerase
LNKCQFNIQFLVDTRECRLSIVYASSNICSASVYAKSSHFPIKEDRPKLSGPQPELGPFADYGKYNYVPRESYFFDRIIQNETVVIPDNDLALFSFVSVWDVARIIIGCLGNERTFNRAFNASADELISYGRLIQVLQIITQKDFKVKEMAVEQINAQQIPLPFPLNEHLIYSGALSQSILGFQYTSFLEGMRETYQYYLIGKGLK